MTKMIELIQYKLNETNETIEREEKFLIERIHKQNFKTANDTLDNLRTLYAYKDILSELLI
jgi:5-bromo-4-chloroindolyl phosphate hydrolysis protein